MIAHAGLPDLPFEQPVSVKYPLPAELRGNVRRLCIDQDGIVYLLTSKGVARLFEDKIALDHSYRPLAGKVPRDLCVQDGKLFYLTENEVFSNRDAGKFLAKAPEAELLAVNDRGSVLLASGRSLRLLGGPAWTAPEPVQQLLAHGTNFFVRAGDRVLQIGPELETMARVPGLTTLAVHDGQAVAGSTNGLAFLQWPAEIELLTRLPSTHIRALASRGRELWAATSRGLWRRGADGSFCYFASRRWLDSDDLLDVQVDPSGHVYALSGAGLNKIEFHAMTLAQKAMHYERKIRQRHIRYGFCAELRLKTPGDISSAEMIDTDNDGTWSNYYMASQAFRYAATRDEQARRNAWETFEALERLEEINPLEGFPSRTFERAGFKVSDPERWHPVGDGFWDWKAHTSSDEIAAHAFGSAVLYETAAGPAEKERIARFISKIVDHILRNNWYLIDVDGKPTLWARWNPEYVNWFPPSIVDRRLNSAEIVALLQFAHAITGKALYREKAFELIEKHGYLENILSPTSKIAKTAGFIHQGNDMGDEWNHSDDLLSFVTYWVLHRFAFDDDLRSKYAAAIADHWAIEKHERNPLWAFVHASTGAKEFEAENALWTLRHFPLDMTDWSVANSHRQDITRKSPNFRGQELEELLPPDERRITRWNGQPFVLDGGSGGHIELAGDEFLLPYWMGRYLGIIQ